MTNSLQYPFLGCWNWGPYVDPDQQRERNLYISFRPKTKANPKRASMPRTQSATILALSWQCQQWCHTNDFVKNKKRCRSCRAWRDGDGIAPLSMRAHGNMCNKAGGVDNVGSDAAGSVSLSFCSCENDSPNKASPCKVGTSQEKSGEERKSPSQGNNDVAIQNADDGGRTVIPILTGEK